MRKEIVALFPGQGAYSPGILSASATDPVVRKVLSATDAVGAEFGIGHVSGLLLDPEAPQLGVLSRESPARLMLAIFAAGAVGYSILSREHHIAADIFLGHSFGEITALTAAGVFTVEDGARVLCLRSEALRQSPPPAGGLMAVPLSADRVEHLLAAGGFPGLVVAAVNAPRQTVVSGPDQQLEHFAPLAAALGAPVSRLQSPYLFHNPLCEPAARVFAESVASVPTQPMAARVFSSIHNSFYPDADTALAALPGHLTRPVRYLEAVRQLHAHGGEVFIECGVGRALTDLLRKSIGDAVTVNILGGSPVSPQLSRLRTAAPSQTIVPSESFPVPTPYAFDQEDAGSAAETDHPAPSTRVAPEFGKGAGRAAEEKDRLIAELCTAYAEKLGYPEEVFTAEADIEADLGVDSVKRIELLRWTADRYDLGDVLEGIRPGDLPTATAIADLVLRTGGARHA